MRRFKAYPPALAAVLLLAPCFAARAQQPAAAAPARPAAEEARVARLVGLAKVWGTVKYFHPSLAYREIDWDKALVEAIPKVRAARTPQEYSAALTGMLAALVRQRRPREAVRRDAAHDVAAGRDEILEAAVKYLRENVKK